MSITQEDMLEEAKYDIMDAAELLTHHGSEGMASFQASLAAEKALVALGMARGIKVQLNWDISRVFDALKDIEGIKEFQEDITLLARHSTPQKVSDDQPFDVVKTGLKLVEKVFDILKADKSTLPNLDLIRGQLDRKEDAKDNPAEGDVNFERSKKRRTYMPRLSGRSETERSTSYVKVMLLCQTCGVRIPRTKANSSGRVPCPYCGRPMVLAR